VQEAATFCVNFRKVLIALYQKLPALIFKLKNICYQTLLCSYKKTKCSTPNATPDY